MHPAPEPFKISTISPAAAPAYVIPRVSKECMEIFVNGNPRAIPADYSVYRLLEELGLLEKRLALEVNREIVPRSTYAAQHLNPGDRVEVVHAIGGG